VDISNVVRDTIRSVGYADPSTGFDYQSCAVVVMLEEQSEDVAIGVDRKGAGDQGICIGYATDEGQQLPVDCQFMPVPAYFANRLAERLGAVSSSGKLPYLYPDGKTQVSVRYENGKPAEMSHVVLCAHHHPEAELAQIRRDLKRLVIKPILDPTGLLTKNTKYWINPLGAFTEGGPRADSGLTGRKITVDCYGSACPHGGSAFSGKDPTKPDRSGSYGARWVAKNLVAAGICHRCSVEMAYVIGHPAPISLAIDSYGSALFSDTKLEDIVRDHFDLTPAGIIENLDLRRPIYAKTALYGHFGRPDPDFTWESLKPSDQLRAKYLKKTRKKIRRTAKKKAKGGRK
jgi:S-adenosylmethionine synthetase